MDSSYCTIKDYSKQEMIVNASGTTSKGNTKIVGSSSANAGSGNAMITVYKEASN